MIFLRGASDHVPLGQNVLIDIPLCIVGSLCCLHPVGINYHCKVVKIIPTSGRLPLKKMHNHPAGYGGRWSDSLNLAIAVYLSALTVAKCGIYILPLLTEAPLLHVALIHKFLPCLPSSSAIVYEVYELMHFHNIVQTHNNVPWDYYAEYSSHSI